MGDQAIIESLMERLRAEFGGDLLGVLVGGSRVRGEGGPNSDLDVVVVIDRPQHRRWNALFGGVEIEMFINPPPQMRRYFEEGRRNGRGQIPHLCSTGRIVFDPKGVVASLQTEACAIVQAGPPPLSARERWQFRYAAADALRDIDDVADGDNERATFLIGLLLAQLIDQHYRMSGRWLQKRKRVLIDLALWDEPTSQRARRALNGASTIEHRVAATRALADHVLAPLGGIMPVEWSTDWEPLSPEASSSNSSDLLPISP
jgi:hypothetical protein